ncbi:hypothetical protein [Bradyrhizobium diazoefficiens]|uniref:hypothetical protein n=1 Tax=Bradyrhizobium diazoefficiens TaxID=1355477 RepID=UPI0027150F52|nr:hypothetical protein [Bradyrhizobium diazoefficiens]WLA53911.1 hypothetical protein QIH81_25510 [Bradyrhizobium diazoefficiens]
MNNSARLRKSIDRLRPDESLQSIILRLAPFSLATANELLRYALGRPAGLGLLSTDADAIQRLAELGGFALEDMFSRSILRGKYGYIIYRREVPPEWVTFGLRRLAPGVLTDDDIPFHRLGWQLNAINCDVTTGEVLIERCPRCVARLRWRKVATIVTCGECQLDIRCVSPRYVPPDRLSSARRLLAFLLRTGPQLPAPFDKLDDVTTCYAMQWLAYFVTSGPGGKSLRPSCQNAAAGLEELCSWPDSFDTFLLEHHRIRGYGHTAQAASLLDKIDRAGNLTLRHILLLRAAETLDDPSLSAVAAQREGHANAR